VEKIRLGKTNMTVTRLGFGSIPIQRDPDDEAIAIVRRAVELGITFIDTATQYTTSEGRIGRAIAGQRDSLVLATKSMARTPDGIRADLEQSLKRLGTRYIDLYQYHNVSDRNALDKVLDPKGPRSVVDEARRMGQVRHVGITSHQLATAREAVASDQFETIMFPLNYVASEPGLELLELARQHDVGFICMKPFAGGMLDNAPLAVKYLWQFPDVVLIPGIEKMHELEEIARLVQDPMELTAEERERITRHKQEVGDRFCRRCDYCQPCTAGIPISTVLALPTIAKRMTRQHLYTGWVASMMEKAAECTECGECQERCPYNLPIMDMIRDYLSWYQPEKAKYDEEMALRR